MNHLVSIFPNITDLHVVRIDLLPQLDEGNYSRITTLTIGRCEGNCRTTFRETTFWQSVAEELFSLQHLRILYHDKRGDHVLAEHLERRPWCRFDVSAGFGSMVCQDHIQIIVQSAAAVEDKGPKYFSVLKSLEIEGLWPQVGNVSLWSKVDDVVCLLSCLERVDVGLAWNDDHVSESLLEVELGGMMLAWEHIPMPVAEVRGSAMVSAG